MIDLFKNMEVRKYCGLCQKERAFSQIKGFYNLSMGCFSDNSNSTVDVLIITESIARGELDTKQRSFEDSTKININHYLTDPLYSYFQKSMRELLLILNKNGKSWYLTDLVKCYVDKEKKLFRIAINYCKNYLDESLFVLKPKIIISVGGIVSHRYFHIKGKLLHGQELNTGRIDLKDCKIIHSIFPSSRTADKFISNGEWSNIIEKII